MRLIQVLFVFYISMLNSCNTAYKADPHRSAATRAAVTPSDTLIQKQEKGVDFFAAGNDPVEWTLELDLEKGFYFKRPNSQLLIASPVQASKSGGTDTYLTKTDSGMMKVTVYDEICVAQFDKMARKRTEVTINDKRYTGCGNYLYDHTLNNIWELDNIDNRYPQINKRQLPWMEFDLGKNKMLGFDGCNNISSDIKVEGNRIKFSVFTSTKMACPDNEAQKLFSTMLNDHIVDYYIRDGRLTLVLINETKLVFIKKA